MAFKDFSALSSAISSAQPDEGMLALMDLLNTINGAVGLANDAANSYARSYALVQQTQYDQDGNIQDVTSPERQSVPASLLDRIDDALNNAQKTINNIMTTTGLTVTFTPQSYNSVSYMMLDGTAKRPIRIEMDTANDTCKIYRNSVLTQTDVDAAICAQNNVEINSAILKNTYMFEAPTVRLWFRNHGHILYPIPIRAKTLTEGSTTLPAGCWRDDVLLIYRDDNQRAIVTGFGSVGDNVSYDDLQWNAINTSSVADIFFQDVTDMTNPWGGACYAINNGKRTLSFNYQPQSVLATITTVAETQDLIPAVKLAYNKIPSIIQALNA